MTLLTYYLLFATSCAIWACYEIMRPAMQLAEDNDVINEHPYLSYLVMFCVNWIAAPIVPFIILNSSALENAINAVATKVE